MSASGAGAQDADQDPLHARLEAARHSCLVLLGAGEGLFRGREARRHHRPGRGLGRDRHAHDVGRLRRRLRRRQRDHPERGDQARRRAGHGLHDLQPGAVRAADQGHQPDPARSRTWPARSWARRQARPRSSCFRCVAKKQRPRPRQGRDSQHGAEPAGTDAAAGPSRRLGGVHGHELHESGGAEARSRQGLPLDLFRRFRRRSLFQRRDGVAAGSPRTSPRRSRAWCGPSPNRCAR